MQFPGTVYIWNQGPLSSAWAHCISCAPSACSRCRRCCWCPLQCDRQCMEIHLNSAGGLGPYHKSWSSSFLHLLYVLSSPLLLSIQEPPDTFIEWFSNDNKVIGIEVFLGDPRAELAWQGFKHNDEEQWAEYQALVNKRPPLQTLFCTPHHTGLGGAVGCTSDWRTRACRFDPRQGRQHSFVEIDHEIFSTVIFSLPLIQEGQLSVSGKRICTILVNHLED